MSILNYSGSLNAAGSQTPANRSLGVASQLQGLGANKQALEMQLQQQQAAQQKVARQQAARVRGAELLKSGTPDEVATFGIQNPDVMKDLIAAANFTDEEAIRSRIRYAQDVLGGNVSPRQALVGRIKAVTGRGGDASGLMETLKLDDDGIRAAAEKDFAALASDDHQKWKKSTSGDSGLSDKPSRVRETEWFNKQTPEVQDTHMKIIRGEKPTLDEKLKYEESKAEIKEDSAISTARKKSANERRQGYIDSGVTSADNLQSVNRSLDLLNSIETGGIDNALIRAKQTLGIESADEAELSYELGKNVLKQLKPTFGAAFTVNEMLELKRMESGLGKSVAGNKRILKNVAKVIERSAKRGMRAAKSLGDDFAANEISLALIRTTTNRGRAATSCR